MRLLQKIAQCYIELHLYEDALTYCDQALSAQPDNVEMSLRKVEALAYLCEFEKSKEILESLEIGEVDPDDSESDEEKWTVDQRANK